MPTQYTIDGTAEFYDNSINDAETKSASFFDQTSNTGSVTTAEFAGTSTNEGTVVSTAIFKEQSKNEGSATIQNNAIVVFEGDSSNDASITNNVQVVFKGNAVNTSSVATAIFMGSSKNQGTVTTATFVENAVNDTTGTVTIGTYETPANDLGQTSTNNTFVQTDGAFSYGYYSNASKTGPASYSSTAYEAEDQTGAYYVYDNQGNVSELADGIYTEGGTVYDRKFVKGRKTSLSRIRLRPNTWNGSSIIEASTYYYYSGNITSGSTTLYTDAALTVKPDGTYSGVDSLNKINNSTNNWSINSQGVISWSAAANYATQVIGGQTYYYASGAQWDDGTTVLYTNTGLSTVASATYAINDGYRWQINGSGQYSQVAVLASFDGGANGMSFFDNPTGMSSTVIYDSTGAQRNNVTGLVYFDTTDGFSASGYARYTISSGVITFTELYSLGNINGAPYFMDNSSVLASTLLYDVGGAAATIAGIISIDGDYYRVSSSSGVFNAVMVTRVIEPINSGEYYYDGTGATYDSNGDTVSSAGPFLYQGSRYEVANGSMSGDIVTQITLNNSTYYVGTAAVYDSILAVVTGDVSYEYQSGVVTTYRRGITSGVYFSEQVFEYRTSDSTSYYTDNSTPSSVTKVYDNNASAYSGNIVFSPATDLNNFYRVSVTSGTVDYQSYEAVHAVTYTLNSNTMNSGYVNNSTYSSVTKLYSSAGAQINSSSSYGYFAYSDGIRYGFNIDGTGNIGNFIGSVTTIEFADQSGVLYYFNNSTLSTYLTVYDGGQLPYSPGANKIIKDSSNSYYYATFASSALMNYESAVQVVAGGSLYWTTDTSGTLEGGEYLYNNDGSAASNLNVDLGNGTTLTTDSNGQVTITINS